MELVSLGMLAKRILILCGLNLLKCGCLIISGSLVLEEVGVLLGVVVRLLFGSLIMCGHHKVSRGLLAWLRLLTLLHIRIL